MYENLLHNNLNKRRDQLLTSIDELGMSERRQEFDSKKAEFDQAGKATEETKKKLASDSINRGRSGIFSMLDFINMRIKWVL